MSEREQTEAKIDIQSAETKRRMIRAFVYIRKQIAIVDKVTLVVITATIRVFSLGGSTKSDISPGGGARAGPSSSICNCSGVRGEERDISTRNLYFQSSYRNCFQDKKSHKLKQL